MRKLKDILREQAKADRDDRDLHSRTDARRERKRSEAALADLARRLVGLTERQLSALALPEPLLDAVREARAIRSARARDRATRVVRRELRQGDAESIEEQLRVRS
jgi:ribosome-associated protein